MSSSEIPATVNNFGIGEIPITIQNYSDLGGSWSGLQPLTSEQIATAMNDVNSDELENLFRTYESQLSPDIYAKDCITAQQRILNHKMKINERYLFLYFTIINGELIFN